MSDTVLLLIFPRTEIVEGNVEKNPATNHYLSIIDPSFGFGHGVNNAVERATATNLHPMMAHGSSQWEQRDRPLLANEYAPQSQTNDSSGQWISKFHRLGERQPSTFPRVNVLAAVRDDGTMQGVPSMMTTSTAIVVFYYVCDRLQKRLAI